MADVIEFHRVELSDRDWVVGMRPLNPYCNCDYSFGNLFSWGHYYNTEIAQHKGMMVVRFSNDEGSRGAYLMPIGRGDLREVLLDMEYTMRQDEHPLTLMAVQEEALGKLEALGPESFHTIANRDNSDYIYYREQLATLSGKRLQSKRNHVNRFRRSYPDYQYEVIGEENARECLELEEKWFALSERTDAIREERAMVRTSLAHFREIGLMGGCIRVDGEIIAFTLGMPISDHCFGVHIEKADISYDGSFAIINQEFARRIPEQYLVVNREEDLGIPGLRQAKLSYKPVRLLDKYTVVMAF